MKFNSKSVILNGGKEVKVEVDIPPAVGHRMISSKIWEDSISEFNNRMDTRTQVSEIISGTSVDILRLDRSNQNVFLWMFAMEEDMPLIRSLHFILKGRMVFENIVPDNDNIEDVLLDDLLYTTDMGERSIFRKLLTFE